MGVLEVPPKLDLVALHYLVEMSATGSVLRLDKQRRESRPELYLSQITGQTARGQAAELIEQGGGRAGLRVGSSRGKGFPTILHIGVQQPWIALVADRCYVMQAPHQIPGIRIGPGGGQVYRLR